MFMYWAIRAYTTCLCTVPYVCVLQAYAVYVYGPFGAAACLLVCLSLGVASAFRRVKAIPEP